ncbi:MAG: LD-carboxypeptidase, partial [Leptotrichiaceae bacterium]
MLFIEEIGEHTYRVDRMLQQLRLAGKLKNIKGIIIGDFNKV